MTDAVVVDIRDDVAAALSPVHWLTHTEVWRATAKRWSVKAVRQCLIDMHESSLVESRIGGTAGHPVREYRAWK